ncbi:MAG: ATP-binding protein [Candidatus Woesearchaeota archaeon]|jgi:hypothetical protein
MPNKFIKKYIDDSTEIMPFAEFEELASKGEPNLIERKSISDFNDIDTNTSKIKEMLSKEISAFSNYGGGILLIGVTDNGDVEIGTEDIYKNRTKKEWLSDVICTSCTPSINNFYVKKIPHNSKYLYAIIVDESEHAPHQASHGQSSYKYFSRVEGKSRPISGLLVQDIFYRKNYADINLKLELTKINDSRGIASLNITAFNTSLIPAEKVCVLMTLSKKIINGSKTSSNSNYGQDNGQFNLEIIYPEIGHNLLGIEKIHLQQFDTFECEFVIVAKNMKKKQEKYRIHNNQNSFSIIKINF